jgi:ribonuclease T1
VSRSRPRSRASGRTSGRRRGGRRAGGSASVVVGLLVVLVALGLAVHALAGHGSGSSDRTCPIGGLPAQVEQTVEEIQHAGPFPYRQDGVTFDNREHLLPSESLGYYREYTVTTPGSPDRGTRRVIAGGGSSTDPAALYYTGDHYASFCLLTGAP